MIRELDRVILTRPLDDLGLEAGDVGTVVLVHEGGRGFEVEFVTLEGETHAVATVSAETVRPIERNEIAHARVRAVQASDPAAGYGLIKLASRGKPRRLADFDPARPGPAADPANASRPSMTEASFAVRGG